MRAEIISVGTELLLGDILNTNAQYLSQQLAQLGYNVFLQTTVGDNPARLRQLVMEAKERSDILIFTGGLGPTDDDLTKQTVAEAFGDSLVLDEEELNSLIAFFALRGVEMTDNNRKQAMVPLHGRKLPNKNGTAPGAFFEQNQKYAFLLPGPPREMQPMFTEQVRPVLEFMQDAALRSLTLRVFGIGESLLEERIHALLENENPTAALYAKPGEVHIRITAKAETGEEAEAMCREYAKHFHAELGHHIYSDNDDDLAAATVKQLLANGSTVATAESCTGGLLSERITNVPGASGAFEYGFVTYANEAKHRLLGVRSRTLRQYGAVSGEVAAEMAFGAAKKAGSTYSIAITGIAGPDGGTPEKPVGLVYIAACNRQEVFIKKLNLGQRARDYIRMLASSHALDMLRRMAMNLPMGKDTQRFVKGQPAHFNAEP